MPSSKLLQFCIDLIGKKAPFRGGTLSMVERPRADGLRPLLLFMGKDVCVAARWGGALVRVVCVVGEAAASLFRSSELKAW